MKKSVIGIVGAILSSYAIYTMDTTSSNKHLVALAKAFKSWDAAVAKQEKRSCCSTKFDEMGHQLDVEITESTCKKQLTSLHGADIPWPNPTQDKGYALVDLDLSMCQLPTLCALESVNEANTKVVTIFNIVPSHIDCSLLSRIDVSHNNLHELPLGRITATCRHVRDIDASHNAITHVSFAEVVYSDLHTINISHNQLETFDVGTLCRWYPIKSVNIANNKLQDVIWDQSVEQVLNETIDTYSRIDLRGNCLSEESRRKLCQTYVACRQKAIKDRIFSQTLFGAIFGPVPLAAAAPIIGGLTTATDATIGGVYFGLGLFSAFVTGGITYGISYCRNKAQLQEIVQKSREHIIFDGDEKAYDTVIHM